MEYALPILTTYFTQFSQVVKQFDPSQVVIVEDKPSNTPFIIGISILCAVVIVFIVWRVKKR